MSWFEINPVAPGNQSVTASNNLIPSQALGQLQQAQLQQAQMQMQQAQMMHQAALANTHTHTLGGYGGLAQGCPGGFVTSSSGVYGLHPSTGTYQPGPYSQSGVQAVVFPTDPTEGDHITFKFRHGQWTEERVCFTELNPKRNNSGAFSLDEIDEARDLIHELSGEGCEAGA